MGSCSDGLNVEAVYLSSRFGKGFGCWMALCWVCSKKIPIRLGSWRGNKLVGNKPYLTSSVSL